MRRVSDYYVEGETTFTRTGYKLTTDELEAAIRFWADAHGIGRMGAESRVFVRTKEHYDPTGFSGVTLELRDPCVCETCGSALPRRGEST